MSTKPCVFETETEREHVMAEESGGGNNTDNPSRTLLIRDAFRLEWLTIAWMTIEAAVALGSGIAAGSLTLIAFGADSVIELASAGVLVWRLTVEVRRGGTFSEAAEHRASRIAGGLLLALAAYVVASAAWELWSHEQAEFSWSGFIVAAVAIPAMYLLSRRKLAVAEELGSRALRADAMEAVTCAYLSAVVLVGLAMQYLFGAWWIDSVTSLGIVYLLVKEGREAWVREICCD
jgi:divalent metal cation (Fe/Co/Zn/Cd) transporter